MPGKYGAINFVAGAPTEPKPVRSGVCGCGKESFRERYVPGQGWRWLCYACAPEARIERRTNRAGNPQGYVPADIEGAAHVERLNHALQAGDKVARTVQGKEVSGFRARAH